MSESRFRIDKIEVRNGRGLAWWGETVDADQQPGHTFHFSGVHILDGQELPLTEFDADAPELQVALANIEAMLGRHFAPDPI
jgi:hypothetical protein